MPLEAYIVAAKRTSCGKKGGFLSQWHPADLGAAAVDGLLESISLKDEDRIALIDDLIFGCVSQFGPQAGNIGRMVVLASNLLPDSVPGTSVDRQCGSGQQAIHFAAQAVMSGTQDIVIAGGVENMSMVNIGANVIPALKKGLPGPNSDAIQKKFGVENTPIFSQFEAAEIVAEKYNISREEMEAAALESHKRAFRATENGWFDREIITIKGFDMKQNKDVEFSRDEGIRWPLSMEKMKKLPLLNHDGHGRLTAATASQISDGAAAVLICNKRGLDKLGLKPRAKILSLGLAGTDPVSMLTGPIPATRNALEKAGLTIQEIDLYEVNEAFACVPIAWCKTLNADNEKLNVNGGAMALGHPLGATGAKLMTTLLHELERRKARYGLLSICEGGGTANATIIERMNSANL